MNLMYVGGSPAVYIPACDVEVTNGGTVDLPEEHALSLLGQGVDWVRVADDHKGPAKSAGKGVWVTYAVSLGFTAEQLGGKSRDEIVDLVETGTPSADVEKGDD